MIDITKLLAPSTSVTVVPSNLIFRELGNNTYDFKDLLSELIDNSLAARVSGQVLDVFVEILADSNGSPVVFLIRDNASGITHDILADAITPAGRISRDSLNEHGLGMKQAVAALGDLQYLATKTTGEEHARLVREFRFGALDVYSVEFPFQSGTEIAVTGLREIVLANPTHFTRTIVPYLGARYRRFLKPEAKVLNLVIVIRCPDHPERQPTQWVVEETKPVYFHPSTRKNEPVIFRYPLKGAAWEAELTFGYAPAREEEWEELGLEKPNKFHPYRVALSTQGLDLITQDRVILFHQLSELGIVAVRHNDFNTVRGELDLRRGFATGITKNTVIRDAHFEECIIAVSQLLNGEAPGPGGKLKDYLARKTYPEDIPESLLRDRLAGWLKNNPVTQKKDVKIEYVIQGIEGFIDIYADGDAWELKTEQASAFDVYQLFMYMDVGKIEGGFLVAKDFTNGAKVAAEHISTNHGKRLTLAPRDKFPINHPPSKQEMEDYY